MVLFVFPRGGDVIKESEAVAGPANIHCLLQIPRDLLTPETLPHCHTVTLPYCHSTKCHTQTYTVTVCHTSTLPHSRLLTRDSLSPETLPHQCVTLGFTQSHCVTVCHNETLSHSQETFLQQRRLCHTLLLFSPAPAAQYQPLADTKWGHNPLLTRRIK